VGDDATTAPDTEDQGHGAPISAPVTAAIAARSRLALAASGLDAFGTTLLGADVHWG
jgi:hypothetical protein